MTGPVKYTCAYRLASGARFGTEVMATPERIDGVLASRNIGEVVDGAPSPRPPYTRPLSTMLERDGVTAEALHYAIFIGWLAIRSGTATLDDILSDGGLVHELAHHLQGIELIHGRDLSDIVEMARRIERAIPGSPWMGEEGCQ